MKSQTNPISKIFLILTLVVFAGLVGLIIFAQVMALQYVDEMETNNKPSVPAQQVSDNDSGDTLKVFIYITIIASVLLLLLQTGQVVQSLVTAPTPSCPTRRGK